MPNLHLPRRLAFPRNPSFMFLLCSVAACLFAIMMTRPVASFQQLVLRRAPRKSSSRMYMSSSSSAPEPTTFREAEVLGLKLMQQGDYDSALKGMCLVSFVNRLLCGAVSCVTRKVFLHVFVLNVFLAQRESLALALPN